MRLLRLMTQYYTPVTVVKNIVNFFLLFTLEVIKISSASNTNFCFHEALWNCYFSHFKSIVMICETAAWDYICFVLLAPRGNGFKDALFVVMPPQYNEFQLSYILNLFLFTFEWIVMTSVSKTNFNYLYCNILFALNFMPWMLKFWRVRKVYLCVEKKDKNNNNLHQIPFWGKDTKGGKLFQVI